jgi:CcmD family protein
MLRRVLIVFWSVLLLSAPLLAQPPSPEQQNEYVPVSQLPPQETVPAAPLLIAAYIIVWLGLMAYLWSIWRRLSKVEAEMAALQRRTPGAAR